jgi:hypothetical protein
VWQEGSRRLATAFFNRKVSELIRPALNFICATFCTVCVT